MKTNREIERKDDFTEATKKFKFRNINSRHNKIKYMTRTSIHKLVQRLREREGETEYKLKMKFLK